MRIEYLEDILEVARQGSISKAAEKLMISQPSLTREIRAVEEELGLQIFVRSNKGIQCTAQSEKFLQEAQQVVAQYHSWRNTDITKCIDCEDIHIASFEMASHLGIVPVMLKLKETHRNLNVITHQMELHMVLDNMNKAKFDLALIGIRPEQLQEIEAYVHNKRWDFAVLAEDQYKLNIAKKHILAKKDCLTRSDLEMLDLLTYTDSDAFLYREWFDGLSCHSKMYFPNSDGLLGMLDINANAATFWPESVERMAIRSQNNLVVSKTVENEPLPLLFCLIYPQKSFVSPTGKLFVTELKRYYRQLKNK